jgi:biopolymer transport protein ExbD
MQFGQPRPTGRLISLTPLIDVIFILLIFFMVTSSFLDWRSIDLSVSSGTGADSATQRAILISLKSDGSMEIGGVRTTDPSLHGVMMKKLSGDRKKRVVIRSEPNVPLQRAVHVLDILRTMGAANVSLSRKR